MSNQNQWIFDDDPLDEAILMDILNDGQDHKEPLTHVESCAEEEAEWKGMELFLLEKSEQLAEEKHLTWQDLYEQSYSSLYEKYRLLGMNEYSLRLELIRQKQNDALEKWYRKMPFHEHFAVVLAQKLARIFFVIDSGDDVEKKYFEARAMFPFFESDLLAALKSGIHQPYDIINELQLVVHPLFDYKTHLNVQKWATLPPVEFIKYLLSLLKGDEKVAGTQMVHHAKDIMRIFKITHMNLLECRKVINEYSASRFKGDEVYYHEKRRLSTLDNDIWYVYKALHVHNLTLIGFLEIDQLSHAGKRLIWKYLDRLTLSFLYEIAMFRVPIETDIPADKIENGQFTGDIDNDLWVASFNRFWRLELLDYSMEWIRRLKQMQRWNIPSLKYLREVVPAERNVKKSTE